MINRSYHSCGVSQFCDILLCSLKGQKNLIIQFIYLSMEALLTITLIDRMVGSQTVYGVAEYRKQTSLIVGCL